MPIIVTIAGVDRRKRGSIYCVAMVNPLTRAQLAVLRVSNGQVSVNGQWRHPKAHSLASASSIVSKTRIFAFHAEKVNPRFDIQAADCHRVQSF
jgi:hypothetical protein